MSDVKIAAKCIRSWPDAYRMGAHDRRVCKIAADALDEIEQPRRDEDGPGFWNRMAAFELFGR